MLSNPVREWHQTKIELPYGHLGPVVEWCRRNCTEEWVFADIPFGPEGNYKFYFESETDYINFLIWKK